MALASNGSFSVRQNATGTCSQRGNNFVAQATSGTLLSTNYAGEVSPSIGTVQARLPDRGQAARPAGAGHDPRRLCQRQSVGQPARRRPVRRRRRDRHRHDGAGIAHRGGLGQRRVRGRRQQLRLPHHRAGRCRGDHARPVPASNASLATPTRSTTRRRWRAWSPPRAATPPPAAAPSASWSSPGRVRFPRGAEQRPYFTIGAFVQ